jgi:prophage antirepressor-like protein
VDKLQTIVKTFQGRALTTIMYKGRPCWIAREVGAVLGYEQEGRRFVTQVCKEWADEFLPGTDSAVLEEQELRDLKELCTAAVHGFTSSLLVLFESGLYLALAKTSKPAGKALRRFLADEVLPQIARDGSYLPDRAAQIPMSMILRQLTDAWTGLDVPGSSRAPLAAASAHALAGENERARELLNMSSDALIEHLRKPAANPAPAGAGFVERPEGWDLQTEILAALVEAPQTRRQLRKTLQVTRRELRTAARALLRKGEIVEGYLPDGTLLLQARSVPGQRSSTLNS